MIAFGSENLPETFTKEHQTFQLRDDNKNNKLQRRENPDRSSPIEQDRTIFPFLFLSFFINNRGGAPDPAEIPQICRADFK